MINFENGVLEEEAYVEIGGVRYPVVMPRYRTNTPVSAENLNRMQEDLEEKGNIGVETDTYNAEVTYSVGDVTIFNNELYKCTTAITEPETFNLEHWTETSLKEMIDNVASENVKEIISDDMFTMETGVTLVINQSFKIGNAVFLSLKINGNLNTSNTNYLTIDNTLRPSQETPIMVNTAGTTSVMGWLRTGGTLNIKGAATAANTDIRIMAFYLLD